MVVSDGVVGWWVDGYLEEVLAGSDEGELGTGAIRLGLTAPHSLDQHGDLVSHHLRWQGNTRVGIWKNGTGPALDYFWNCIYFEVTLS